MLAHNLKHILTIVPELAEHIKSANIEQDFPLSSKEECLASYIRYNYLTKVAHKPVDPEVVAVLEKAAGLFGIKEQADPYIKELEKYAQAQFQMKLAQIEEVPVKAAEAMFEGNLTGFFDIEKTAQDAVYLKAKYGDQVTSDEIARYTGDAYFNKEAAIASLDARHVFTGMAVFDKFAEVINRSLPEYPTQEEIKNICDKVTYLDKKAHLDARGFNFYKEALSVGKNMRRGMSVKICGKQVPFEKIARLGKERIGQYLGKDIAAGMGDDPRMQKAALESLPLDLQRVLQSMLKSV